MNKMDLMNLVKGLRNFAELDKKLDELVFGHSLGLVGENATDGEIEKAVNVADAVRNLVNALREPVKEDVVECPDEDELDDMADEELDIDTTARDAFKMGYRRAWEEK